MEESKDVARKGVRFRMDDEEELEEIESAEKKGQKKECKDEDADDTAFPSFLMDVEEPKDGHDKDEDDADYKEMEVDDDYGQDDDEEYKPSSRKRAKKGTSSRRNGAVKLSKEKAEVQPEETDLKEEEEDMEKVVEMEVVSGLGRGVDCSMLELKKDASVRPLWVSPDGHVYLEKSSPIYSKAYDFIVTIAEPLSRPKHIHEYLITRFSIFTAVSIGIDAVDIVDTLEKMSKVRVADELKDRILRDAENSGKLKVYLENNRYYLQARQKELMDEMVQNEVIKECRVDGSGRRDDGKTIEIQPEKVVTVREACLKHGYPTVEEYDFRSKDQRVKDLPFDLKKINRREYQTTALSKMLSNDRARSGIIVLPCGAGKTLVGIMAACTLKKACIVLCTSSVSVHQWKDEFRKWSTAEYDDVVCFTNESKFPLDEERGQVLITTYQMFSHGGRRSIEGEQLMHDIKKRDWGLLILDEVHVAPANTFSKAIGSIPVRCKLGLTATLVREDEKISDLSFMIGPKLYEANWMDLQDGGFLARVLCQEIWCPMPAEFYRAYLESELQDAERAGDVPTQKRKKFQKALCACNPTKMRICEYLLRDRHKNDSVLIFSDDLFVVRTYGSTLKIPFIHGEVGDEERKQFLDQFRKGELKSMSISKVGDTSIDLPDANVIIQVSSHYGSRRQEAQRLGRILRPKRSRGDRQEFNAFFYSLVTPDTMDMYYAEKRQRFLVDQGFEFHVVYGLEKELPPGLHLETKSERMDLLDRVKSMQNGVGDGITPPDDDDEDAQALSDDEEEVIRNKKLTREFVPTTVFLAEDASGPGSTRRSSFFRRLGQRQHEQYQKVYQHDDTR
uniref:DNA 3'-5' helicase n=1 Tax=Stygiella incarcerata TaxID=1712417 RepID=A0A192ZIV5_9EUKA|nr:DNA repair helicase XPB1 [Stygiella incarcerata]|eukprot:TRINITY_DN1575_c1_g1_i3.p1 TRINITY_DN1575_c1_g1~~TRINITY_DN1575_c1_g1_i3.p1  ORF type:complete len:845 (-),score=273.39 TRINITY_DN1575_c1_g1_i3:779-3313(-)